MRFMSQKLANIPYLNRITPGSGTLLSILLMSIGMIVFSIMTLRAHDYLSRGYYHHQ